MRNFIIISLIGTVGLALIGSLSQTQPEHIQGTWELESFKYGTDKEYNEVPEFVKYVKSVTDTHFSWASYGEDGDVVGAGGGTYEVEGNKYIEND